MSRRESNKTLVTITTSLLIVHLTCDDSVSCCPTVMALPHGNLESCVVVGPGAPLIKRRLSFIPLRRSSKGTHFCMSPQGCLKTSEGAGRKHANQTSHLNERF